MHDEVFTVTDEMEQAIDAYNLANPDNLLSFQRLAQDRMVQFVDNDAVAAVKAFDANRVAKIAEKDPNAKASLDAEFKQLEDERRAKIQAAFDKLPVEPDTKTDEVKA